VVFLSLNRVMMISVRKLTMLGLNRNSGRHLKRLFSSSVLLPFFSTLLSPHVTRGQQKEYLDLGKRDIYFQCILTINIDC
jgi:hypothetical protein